MTTITTTDGQRLIAHTHGDSSRTPIVLVHGYPDDNTVWDRVVPLLSDDFYLITYDVRGAGDSSRPARRRAYRLSQLRSDLGQVTRQLLGDRPFHLVGHDWGSIQSWEPATEPAFRGRILSFTSISGPCLDHVARMLNRKARNPRELFNLLKVSRYIAVLHLPFAPKLKWGKVSPEQWQRTVSAQEGGADIPVNPNVQRNGIEGAKLYRANILPRHANPRERRAVCPVQVVMPKHDQYVKPDYVEEMRRWVDDCTETTIDGGHWAALSHPDQVAAAIKRFVRSTPGPS